MKYITHDTTQLIYWFINILYHESMNRTWRLLHHVTLCGTVLGYASSCCWISHFIGIVDINIPGIHSLYKIGSVITHLPCQGCLALDFRLNTWLNSHPWNLLILFPEREYSAAVFQAFRLVVLVVFGTMGLQLVPCVSTQCVSLYCFLYFLFFWWHICILHGGYRRRAFNM